MDECRFGDKVYMTSSCVFRKVQVANARNTFILTAHERVTERWRDCAAVILARKHSIIDVVHLVPGSFFVIIYHY
jgi:hypothetical protein